MNQRRRGRKVTSVSTNVKSIVHRAEGTRGSLFSRLNRNGILGVGDLGAVSRVRRKRVRRKFPRMPKPETAHEKPLAPRVRVL